MRWPLALFLLLPQAAWTFSCPQGVKPFRAESYELAFEAFVQGGHLKAALKTAHAALCQGEDGRWRRRAAKVARWLGEAHIALEHLLALAEEGDWRALEEALVIARQLPDHPTLYRLLLKRPRDLTTIAELAQTALLTGHYREAALWFREGYRKSHDPEWLWRLVEMGYFLDWTEEERGALERLVLTHGDPKAVARLADLYLWRGEVERAYRIVHPHAEKLLVQGNSLPLEIAWRLGKIAQVDRWLAQFSNLPPLWTERWVLLAEREKRWSRAWQVWMRSKELRWFRLLLTLTSNREELDRLFRSLSPHMAQALASDPLYLISRARWAFFHQRQEAWSWLAKALRQGEKKKDLLVQALWLWVEHASRTELLWLKPVLLSLPDDPFFPLKVSFLVRIEEPFLALDLVGHRWRSTSRDVALLVSLIDLLQATDQVELADGWRAYLMAHFARKLSPFEIALFKLTFSPETLLDRWFRAENLAEKEERWRNLLLSLAARIESPMLMRWLRQTLYRTKNRPLPGWNVPFALSERDHEALFREIERDDLPYRDRIMVLKALGWPEHALRSAQESFDRNGRDAHLYRQLHRLSWELEKAFFSEFLSQWTPTVQWSRLRFGGRWWPWPGHRLLLNLQRDRSETQSQTVSWQLDLRLLSRRSPQTTFEIGLFQSFAPSPFTGITLKGQYPWTPRGRLEGEGWWQRREGWDISLELAQKGRSDGAEIRLFDQIAEGVEWHLRTRLERFRHRKREETFGHQALVSMTYTHRVVGTPLTLSGTFTYRDFWNLNRKRKALFFAEGMQWTIGLLADQAVVLEDLHLGHLKLRLEGSWIERLGWGGNVWLTYRLPSLAAKDHLELQFGYLRNQGTQRTKEGAFHFGLSWSWRF